MLTISNSELDSNGFYHVAACEGTDFIAEIPSVFLKLRRAEVIQAYANMTGMAPHEIEFEFHGGIDNWIGFGSVTCFELGGGTLVGYGYNEIQMIVLS